MTISWEGKAAADTVAFPTGLKNIDVSGTTASVRITATREF